MEQRTLITIVVCLGLIIAWMLLFQPGRDEAARNAMKSSAGTASSGTGQLPAAQAGPQAPTVAQPAAAEQTPEQRGAEQQVVVEQEGLHRITLSSWGGRIRSYQLLDPQYQVHPRQRNLIEIVQGWFGSGPPAPADSSVHPVDLVTVPQEPFWPLALTLPGSGVELTGREPYRVVSREGNHVIFRHEGARLTIDKEYRFQPDSNAFDLVVKVTNRSDAPLAQNVTLSTNGWQDPGEAEGGIFTGAGNPRTALCSVGDEIIRRPAIELQPAWEVTPGNLLWGGTANQYFLQAVLPRETPPPQQAQPSCSFLAKDNVVVNLVGSGTSTLAAGQTSVSTYKVYFGPKDFYTLKKVGSELQLAVDFRWGWLRIICEPMLWLMRQFHSWTGNWGVAIIFLTLFVKLAMFYFTHKSFQSMAALSKLKPEMEALRKKYDNDKAKLNQAMLDLYKEHKVNPMGGCLPMLLQMPIYFALYQTIYSSADLYQANFILYIRDLTAPDPYFIMPLLLGVVMFVQQKLTPTTMDNAQARMMLYMMPIMFTAFMLFLPSGLVLYILANSVLTIGQQMIIKHRSEARA